MNLNKLKDEFPPEDIEWRVQQSGEKNGRPWAIMVPYVTNRAIMDRLDEVCGPENWSNSYQAGPQGGVVCTISIHIGDQWIEKSDGAENTNIDENNNMDPVKGGLSNSMKRAAVQWGIGRYMYKWDSAFANFSANGILRMKIGGKNGTWYNYDNPTPRLKAGKKPTEPKDTKEPELEEGPVTPKDILNKISESKHSRHLANIAKKYQKDIEALTEDNKERIRADYSAKMKSLKAREGEK